MKGSAEAPLLNSRVKSLELELKILKAQMARTPSERKLFSSLYGVLKDQSESTIEEIQEAEYRGLERIP